MTIQYDIDISLEDDRWSDAIELYDDLTSDIVRISLEHLKLNISHIEISIVLANDDFVQDLNKTYRGKDKPTNVLSFPQSEPEEIMPMLPYLCMGDIILSLDTLQKEIKEQKKTLKDHYTHMLVHGILHLLHYDHITNDEALIMEGLEISILDKMSIKNPYED